MTRTKKNACMDGKRQASGESLASDGRTARNVFGNLKIGLKLALAFGILVVFVLVMVWLAFQSSARAIGSNSLTKDLRVPAVLAATQAQTNLLRMLSSVRAHLIFGDEQSRSDYDEAQQHLSSDLSRLATLCDTPALHTIQADFDRLNQLSEKMFGLRNNLLENEPAQRILIREADFDFNSVLEKTKQIALAQAQRPPSVRHTDQLVVITDFQRSFALMVSALRRYVASGAPVFKYEFKKNRLENNIAWKKFMAEHEFFLPYQQINLKEIDRLRESLAPLPQKMFAIVESDRTREDLYLFKTRFAPKSDSMLQSLDGIVSEQTRLLESQLEAGSLGLRATQQQTIIGGVMALIFGLGLAFGFQRAIAGPIVRLTDAATRLSKGDLTIHASAESKDEIGMLAFVFNNMTVQLRKMIERLENQAEQLSRANEELKTEIAVRRQAESQVRKLNEELEQRVIDRTADLENAVRRAESANHAKSVFLANMSHELRTPLNAILGFSQLMQRDTSLVPKQREYLDTINRSGEHLLSLINDVLEISKIEARQITLEAATFDLHAFLCGIERMFDSSMDAKGLRFEVIGIDAVPRYVKADENKLRQVLINLLGNAVKFTEQGGIIMRVALLDGTSDRMRLGIEVEDTGAGIAEDELDRVFAYFEQTAGGKAQKSGTGLGLAISRDFARMMGGDITVASKEGKGSTFCLEIDIEAGSEADMKAGAMRESLVVGLAPDQKVPRILVAEDMEDSRTLLVQLLKAVGFQVEEAANGKEAVEMFHSCRPDFVWMDIRMPVMDGLEAVRRIRETEAGKSAVIAALTAHALEEEREEILVAGCDDFVRKPFREREIFEVMGRCLGLNYVYGSDSEEEEAAFESGTELTPERLSSLPAGVRMRLYEAAVLLDMDRTLELIEEITGLDAPVGNALRLLAENLDYGRLVRLLENNHDKSRDV